MVGMKMAAGAVLCVAYTAADPEVFELTGISYMAAVLLTHSKGVTVALEESACYLEVPIIGPMPAERRAAISQSLAAACTLCMGAEMVSSVYIDGDDKDKVKS